MRLRSSSTWSKPSSKRQSARASSASSLAAPTETRARFTLMLTQALAFLLETFLGLFALALLLRFYLQLLRAPARNPLSTFLAALTDWIVVPARRVIPG